MIELDKYTLLEDNNNMKNGIILFKQGDFTLKVTVTLDKDAVWFSQKQMADLFEVSTDNISLHIKNILKEGELDESTTEKSSVVQKDGNRTVKKTIYIYIT